MKIVIELVDDNRKPLKTDKGLTALRMLLRYSNGEEGELPKGCLELADLSGRALLARVEGVVDSRYDALVPYIAPPLGEETT